MGLQPTSHMYGNTSAWGSHYSFNKGTINIVIGALQSPLLRTGKQYSIYGNTSPANPPNRDPLLYIWEHFSLHSFKQGTNALYIGTN